MPNPKDTLSLVERLRERAAIARGEKTGTALGDAIHFEEAADEIERLRAELDEARELFSLVREYISECDAPVKDYLYRASLRDRIRASLSTKDKDNGNG